MILNSYRVSNYRRLRDVHVDLANELSIFVGANNSGKTSATHILQTFIQGKKSHLSLFDFSAHAWKELNQIGENEVADLTGVELPAICLDLWFEVSADDLYLVVPILPSSNWQDTLVGMRVEFSATDVNQLLTRFREKKQAARKRAAGLPTGSDDYAPWPKLLTDYLERELHKEYEFKYYVLDRSQFDHELKPLTGYKPAEISTNPGGAAILASLVRVDSLSAQRHLSDNASDNKSLGGRAEDLSRRLSRFYERNLQKREDDDVTLQALFKSETGLNSHLMSVFDPTLKKLASLGYPGLGNPRLEIKSGLNPATVMSQEARVHYVIGEDKNSMRLPDTHSGLGFKQLIYMVVEILDLQERWIGDEEKRAPLHLILIEEPEAHLHAQLQQVFVRNVLDLLVISGDAGSAFKSQVVITTHSPHITYERGFAPIRYFRRNIINAEQTTEILNLSRFQQSPEPKDRDFLLKYLKLAHCDLFFADAAILVEGNVERLLLPLMIEKEAKSLRSAALSILEVCGAFGHRFKELIEFLGITTLVITDIDSVERVETPTAEEEDEEKEFQLPAKDGATATTVYGKTCLPSTTGAITANQTLIQWLPKKLSIDELTKAPTAEKCQLLTASTNAFVRVAYQVPIDVTYNKTTSKICGRTFEEAFGLQNSSWCQAAEQKHLGIKLRTSPQNPTELAARLHKRITGKNFDKTKFALGVLSTKSSEWCTPEYIKEGLLWLTDQIKLEPQIEAPTDKIVAAAAATSLAGEAS